MKQNVDADHRALDATSLSVGISVALVVLGIAALLVPEAVSVAVGILILWIIVFTGLAHLVHAWDARGNPMFIWRLAVGVLYLGGGLFLLLFPGFDAAFLSLAVAGLLGLESLLLFGAYAWLRSVPGTVWIALDGLLTAAMAVLIVLAWPATPMWLLAFCVGLNIISTGVTRFLLARGRGGPLQDVLP